MREADFLLSNVSIPNFIDCYLFNRKKEENIQIGWI